MKLISKVFANSYRDSVLLMKIASRVRMIEGVDNAEVMVATEANKLILEENGLLTDAVKNARPSDLIISVKAIDDKAAQQAIETAEDLVVNGPEEEQETRQVAKNLNSAVAIEPNANLAILSIPGAFVKKEAIKALDKGLNLLIFSDNVPIEDEVAIKTLAGDRDLLVMGPDCGTAIIGGVALAFANKVQRGNVGMIGASGTGLQEVSVLLSNSGVGISHVIGTGSNDVSDSVGGLTMSRGIRWLDDDPDTDLIVVVSKPPGARTYEKLVTELGNCRKPVVVNFLGKYDSVGGNNLLFTKTLEETAIRALEIAGKPAEVANMLARIDEKLIVRARNKTLELSPHQKYVRGLFTGGTLATEACIIQQRMLSSITANVKLPGVEKLANPHVSTNHCIVDLGADEFTVGKPHPMIDPEMRRERLLAEAADPETAVILLDFVLGFGVHPDPVGATLPYIQKAREISIGKVRYLPIVASVCGTDGDPQQRARQVKLLEDNDVFVLPTNAQACRIAAQIALRFKGCE